MSSPAPPDQPRTDSTPLAQQIAEALLGAFPGLPDWERLLGLGLGVTLATVTLGRDLREAAFAVLRWADAQDGISALLDAVGRHSTVVVP